MGTIYCSRSILARIVLLIRDTDGDIAHVRPAATRAAERTESDRIGQNRLVAGSCTSSPVRTYTRCYGVHRGHIRTCAPARVCSYSSQIPRSFSRETIRGFRNLCAGELERTRG